MSDVRREQASREAEAWAAFRSALGEVPRERWEESEVLPGWSVKELLWHMAGWLETCSRRLEGMRTGEPAGGTVRTVDERNDELAAQARTMTVDAVHEGLLAARERVRLVWDRLPEIDGAAIQELAEETYEHYEEHVQDLRRFAG